jgi:hypothetical protein
MHGVQDVHRGQAAGLVVGVAGDALGAGDADQAGDEADQLASRRPREGALGANRELEDNENLDNE